jgi:hypothetical protein
MIGCQTHVAHARSSNHIDGKSYCTLILIIIHTNANTNINPPPLPVSPFPKPWLLDLRSYPPPLGRPGTNTEGEHRHQRTDSLQPQQPEGGNSSDVTAWDSSARCVLNPLHALGVCTRLMNVHPRITNASWNIIQSHIGSPKTLGFYLNFGVLPKLWGLYTWGVYTTTYI